ncbi:methyltransferase domain-containing protein [Aureimonas phyllosphaerae]|uniref:SAM-dependent methyltransferase n=1 Tax=Aureimonas phyllosphaerae TaxID=1166078 RepID=A0A7W6FUD3_9HYPH|nr:methyltransferase domain-containing protein [Aureimonas phyllosphaerae]MBB3935971.1 SAM-dependent methyltransferase [Aureimonas phyllosphaerae]MBB3960304.1 SAM-dependent methyltransferase [Aureimonas phyllosphaerae]SFF36193.1 Methyltransferase domain-containing protein [Aureimonas phyllosphaerae]
MTANAPFDRALIDRRRVRAAARAAPGASFLLDAVADELAERLSLVQRQFAVGVELAGHTGALAARLGEGGQVERLLRIERDARFLGPGEGVVADEEALPLRDESVDLVLSPLSLHLTNDTPGVLVQIRRALRPDGLFLAALLGGETLNELRASLLTAEAEISGGASPRVAPFADLREAGSLLQRAGFALPVIDQDRLTVRYASMFELMRDLRDMGMSNMLHARARRPVGRQLFFRAADIYAERFADPDGRLRATFDVVYLSGWKPHESQQKPMKPGSATHSLAEALRPKS